MLGIDRRVGGGPPRLDRCETPADEPVEHVVDPLPRQAGDPSHLGARRPPAPSEGDVRAGLVGVETEVQEGCELRRLIHQSIVTTRSGFANATGEHKDAVPFVRRFRLTRILLALAAAAALAATVGASAGSSDTGAVLTSAKHVFWGQSTTVDSASSDLIWHGGNAGPGAIGVEQKP